MKENINLFHFLFFEEKNWRGGGSDIQCFCRGERPDIGNRALFLHRVYEFGVAFQVTVIEEAVKYIDELHRALFERLQSKGNIHRN